MATTIIGPTDPPYNFLPNAIGIIDGTEIFIQHPSNLMTQKFSYSDYKSHTTVKYLIAIDTFTGVLSFSLLAFLVTVVIGSLFSIVASR